MSGYNAFYCTLDEAKREIRSKNTRDDAYLLGLLPALSQRLMKRAGRDFEPIYETRTIFPNRMNTIPRQNALKLNDFLLELTAVTIGGTAVVVGTDVDVYPTDGIKPYTKLYLLSTCSSTVSWYGTGCNPVTTNTPVAVNVTGYWGYKERYALDGWHEADTIQAAALTADADKFKVVSVSGADPRGFTPRFSPGQLIRIDDEMMRVQKTNTSKEVTVLRAQRGTVAAAHSQGAAVLLWNAEEDVRRAAYRWAALQYQRRGVFETARIEEVVITLPADIPQEVDDIIQRYQQNGSNAGNF